MAGPHLEICLLGGFAVRVDGEPVPRERWERPQARTLVKLLALAPNHRLHREQVIDALWPEATVDQAAPRLHKLAHYARGALGDPAAIILESDQVALGPDPNVTVDLDEFERSATAAVERGDRQLAHRAAELHGAGLLPEDRYEHWCEDERRRLDDLYRDVLRVAERWADLLAVEPADEAAHLALMRRHAEAGNRVLALRQYERLERDLLEHVGVGPGDEARELRDELVAQAGREAGRPASARPGLLGREAEVAAFEKIQARVVAGHGRTLLLVGPTGIGKTTLARWIESELAGRGWVLGFGEIASIEAPAPGAPVLEVLRRLADRDPDALDELSEEARADLTSAWRFQRLPHSDEAAAQRVMVAAEALLGAASVERPVAFIVDDLDRADHATLRLFHYLARAVRDRAVLLVGTHRPVRVDDELGAVRASLLPREVGEEIVVPELDPSAAAELLERSLGEEPDPALRDRVVEVVGGNPLLLTEAARAMAQHTDPLAAADDVLAASVAGTVGRLLPEHAAVLHRLALLGDRWPVDWAVDVAAGGDPDAPAMLEELATSGLVDAGLSGYGFRHPAVGDAIRASIPPHQRRELHRELAERLLAVDAPPARVAHHLVEGGEPAAAVPHQLAAASRASQLGAYDDALEIVDAALAHATGDPELELLALRADLLDALGDPGAVAAYARAIDAASEERSRALRAKRARTAMTLGDIESAEESLDGLEPDGGDADGLILLAKGMLAFFHGDLDGAEQAARDGRRHALREDVPSRLLDAITLDSLVAHTRGRWYERIREELALAAQAPESAAVVFDSHLCVAEYLLYGSTGYDDVVEAARSLRESAEEHGVTRAVAFAATLEGEARLMAGEFDAARELLDDAVALHRGLRAPTGEAHCLQRLAEVAEAQGRAADARRMLEQALGLARWSPLSRHLLPRIYGSMVSVAEAPDDAVAVVEQAIAAMGPEDQCLFCPVMFEVPAAVACADAGLIDDAARHLERAEELALRWHPSTWDAAVLEARAHLLRACGEWEQARELLERAATGFGEAGQPMAARRCQQATLLDVRT